jgi:hypothetical protein
MFRAQDPHGKLATKAWNTSRLRKEAFKESVPKEGLCPEKKNMHNHQPSLYMGSTSMDLTNLIKNIKKKNLCICPESVQTNFRIFNHYFQNKTI